MNAQQRGGGAKKMQRLDLTLCERGLAESREKAKALIMAGEVVVNGKVIDKAGTRVSPTAAIEVRGKLPYVSRGGLKLARALEVFPVEVRDRVCLDAGASTGGFTDCLLQKGAQKVIAVDVGYGQFAWKLRQDPRVILMEKTNVRYLTQEQLPELPSLITADLSFISLEKVLIPLVGLLTADGEIICLVKPQFEAGRDKVGKKGVVREAGVHLEVLERIIDLGEGLRLKLGGVTYSPLLGPEGNIEFLVYWRRRGEEVKRPNLEALVDQAWQEVKG
ncbi:MAG TPA: TlyA family RNA methyltransferase [Firmicutes bacterium]|nr:TlyA family RNA methyltransferase [Bacillota bacterium]